MVLLISLIQMDKLKIIIAGPGAGKTYNLKNEVINCLSGLDRNRFCAVITYTNAATEELRQRISKDIPIPPNVFISTIHSFLIRFIIEPFGHLVDILPVEKNYIDGPLVELHENFGHITQKALKTIPGIDSSAAKDIINILKRKWLCSNKGNINKNFKLNDNNFKINLPNKYCSIEKDIIKAIKENCVFKSEKRTFEIKRRSTYLAETLSENGIVSYDNIIGVSSKIINDYPSILNVISNRLQFIFIDEYQDSRMYIHQIFQKVISLKGTKVTVIGDPLQAVFKFTYLYSLIRNESKSQPNSFNETPMMLYKAMFRNGIDQKLLENHRSSVHIVNFINEYFLEIQHKQTSKTENKDIPVYFINKTIASEICSAYRELRTKHDIENVHTDNLKKLNKPFLKDFFLTSDWIDNEKSKKTKLKDIHSAINGLSVKLEKGNHRISSVLQEVSRCILAVAGIKKQDFINSIHDEIEYRKFCFEMARCLKTNDFNDSKDRINSIREQFRVKFNIIDDSGKQVDVEKSLNELSSSKPIILSHYPESCYSSIHSAKGLEATSVLAIAYSKSELYKWLNFQEANNNLDDDYRLGYVAFSRARDMLCIACLGEIFDETKNKLESLNIVFYPK